MRSKSQSHRIQFWLSLPKRLERALREVLEGHNIRIRMLRKSTFTVSKMRTKKSFQPNMRKSKDQCLKMCQKRPLLLRYFTTMRVSFETQRRAIQVTSRPRTFLKGIRQPQTKRKEYLRVTFSQSTRHHRSIQPLSNTQVKRRKGWKRRIP